MRYKVTMVATDSKIKNPEPGASTRIPETCILRCGGFRPFLEIPRNQGMSTTTLVQCNYCNLVFENPRPIRTEIDALYKSKALWTNSQDAEGNPRSYVKELLQKKPIFRDLSLRVEKRKSEGRLLDIGCGPGLLETEMDPSRWQVTGVEMSEFISDFGAKQLGTHILNSTFEQVSLPHSHFDVVVMKYVLDHMEEPFEALKKVRTLIKPDGLLLVADLVNIDSFCARFFREGHRLFHPMHFTYFSPKTISQHLERAGFSVIKIEYPYFNTPYFTFKNLAAFALRVLQRGLQQIGCWTNERIYSTAFYGNMLDVWAVPV